MNTNITRVWWLALCGAMVLAWIGLTATANQESLPDWAVPYGQEFWKVQTTGQMTVVGDPVGPIRLDPGFNLAEAVARRSHELRSEKGGVVGGSQGYAVHIGDNGITLAPPAPKAPNAKVTKSAATAAVDPCAAMNLHTREIRRGGDALYAHGVEGEPGAWVVQGNTAQKRLGACGIVEHVESRSEGVEVSWILRERPAGSGPLSVIMDMDGVRYDGATRSGLRFADASGAERLRVADATAVDSAGRRWTLPTTCRAGGLHIEVPEQVLKEARYPLAIDPLLQPQLVKDIDSWPNNSNPLSSRVVMGGKLYFQATDPWYGAELWVTDGTVAGTYRVKDINSGSGSSSPNNLTVMGSTLFFSASDGSTGSELWKSDGTEAGTVLVKDINGGSGGSSPANLTVMGTTLLFAANDGSTGVELWKSDGTTAGTSQVKDIYPGGNTSSSSPANLTVMNGVLYFSANDGTTGAELWKSDGTTAGTSQVKDIYSGSTASSPTALTVMNGVLYFSANGGATQGAELWASDGTSGGTVLVKDIRAGATGSSPALLTAIGSTLYFRANDGSTGVELWKSDGTSVGTVLVKDIYSGASSSTPANLTAMGSTLYFAATDGSSGIELWKSDGTTAGTVRVKDINGSGNGLTTTTPLTVMNGALYFPATDGSNGIELWKSDGTTGGTVLVKDINGGSGNGLVANAAYLTVMGSTLFFAANDGVNGKELWTSDGTTVNTAMLKDIAQGSEGSSAMYLTPMGSAVYFTAQDVLGNGELWSSDGTSNGTVQVKDINSGTSFGSNPYNFATLVSGATTVLCFSASSDPTYANYELWKSDGTSSGTLLVKEIYAGNSSGSFPSYSTTMNGILFFQATDGTGAELWKSDGTTVGTVQVKDINSGSGSSSPAYLTVMDSTLYFTATDGSTGVELWKSDGTSSGTILVKDINGSGNSSPYNLVVMGSTLYFTATDGSTGVELWKSDGTSSGTILVKDINGSGNSSPSNLVVMGSTLYFTADDGVNGRELWKSDGTSSGTVLLKDINSGSGSSSPSYLTGTASTLLFAADDGVNGRELWKSDGTSAGTVLVKDINSGSASSSPANLKAVAVGTLTKLVFTANDGVNGSELWQSDGTANGTYLVTDIEPGAQSSTAGSFTQIGSNIFFTATTTANGQELWLMQAVADNLSLPAIANADPSNVVSGSAWANATLTQNGGDAATVIVYWGPTDGGTNATAWSNTASFASGQWVDGSSPTTNLTGLAAGEWFYTFAAVNSGGVAWGGTSKYFLQSSMTLSATDPWCGAASNDYATVTVYRATSCTGAVLKVNYSTSGTATNGVHYTATPASGTLQFSAGSTSATIRIAPKSPWNTTADRSIIVTLTNGLYLIGSPSSDTCTLVKAVSVFTWDGSTAAWTNTAHWTSTFPGLLPANGSTGIIASGQAQVSTNTGLYNPANGETAPAEIRVATNGSLQFADGTLGQPSLSEHSLVLDGGTLGTVDMGSSDVRYDYDLKVRSASILAPYLSRPDRSGILRLFGALRDYDGAHTGRLTSTNIYGQTWIYTTNNPFSGGWYVPQGVVGAGAPGALGTGDITITNSGTVGWGISGNGHDAMVSDTNMPSITVWNGGTLAFCGTYETVAQYSNAPGKTITLKDGGKIGTLQGDWLQMSIDAPLHVSGNVTFEYTNARKWLTFAGDMINDGLATITWNGKAGTDAGYTAIAKADNAYTGNWILTTINPVTYLSVQNDGALGTGSVELRSGSPVLDISQSLKLYNLIYGVGTLGTAGRTLTLQPRYRNSTLTDAGVAPGTNAAAVVGTLTNAGNLAFASLTNYNGSGSNAYCKVQIAMATNASGAVQASQVQVLGNLTGLSNADLVVTAPYFLPTSTNTILMAANDLSAQSFHSISFNIATQSFRVFYVGTNVQVVVDRPYTLTYTAGAGGTISGTSTQTAVYGATGTVVTAVPDSGYKFTGWSDSVATSNRQDGPVSNDVSVTANFMPAALGVIFNGSATNMGAGTATLKGHLMSGGDTPTVYLFWGPTDGSTNAAAWSNAVGFAASQWADGSDPQTNLTGLAAQDYFYTYAVSNASGVGWASPSVYFIDGTITLTAPDASCGSSPTDTATLLVTRPSTCTGGALAVYCAITGGAIDGVDVTVSPASGFTLASGQSSTNIVITPKAPWNTQAARTFNVTLTAGAYVLGSPSTEVCTLERMTALFTWDGTVNAWTNSSHWTGGITGLLPANGMTGVIASGTAQVATTNGLYNAANGETAPAEIRIQAGGTLQFQASLVGQPSLNDQALVLSGGTLGTADMDTRGAQLRYDYDIRVRANSIVAPYVSRSDRGGWMDWYGTPRDYDATHTGLLIKSNIWATIRLRSANSTFTGGWDVREGDLQSYAQGALGAGPVNVSTNTQVVFCGGTDTNMPSITVQNGGKLGFCGGGNRSNAPGATITMKDGSEIGSSLQGDYNTCYIDVPIHVAGNVAFGQRGTRVPLWFTADLISDGPCTIWRTGSFDNDEWPVTVTKADNAYTGNWVVAWNTLSAQDDGALGTGWIELRGHNPTLDIGKSLKLYNLISGNGTLGTAGRTLTLQPRYRNATLTDAGVSPGSNAVYVTGILTNAGNLAFASLTNYDGAGHDAYCKVQIAIGTNSLGAVQASQLNVVGALTGLSNAMVQVSLGCAPASTNGFTIVTAGSRSGQFANGTTVDCGTFGGNRYYGTLVYGATSVILTNFRAQLAIVNVTASQSIGYGTASVTLTGAVSAVGLYAPDGETVSVTINSVTSNAVVSGGAGGFSVVFATASLGCGTYTITYSYGGDANFNPASDTSTALTVEPVGTVFKFR